MRFTARIAMPNIWSIIKIIPEYRYRILAVIVASTAVGLAGAIVPLMFRAVVNVIISVDSGQLELDDGINAVLRLMGTLLALRLLIVLANYFLERQSGDLWLKSVTTLRNRILEKLSRLSLDYYETNQVGDIMERFSAIPTITQWLFQLSEGVLASALQTVFCLIVLLVKTPTSGLIMAALIPINLVVLSSEMKRNRPLRRDQGALVGSMSALIQEMVSQIATVRNYSGEEVVKARYEAVQRKWKGNFGSIRRTQSRSNLILGAVNVLAVMLATGLILVGAVSGAYTAGDAILVFILSQMIIASIQPIAQFTYSTGEIDALADRLVQILEVPSVVHDRETAIDVTKIESIEFRNVYFRYPDKEEYALSDISFMLCRGQVLGLMGPSGSGKSSIIKLILRHHEPAAGCILINGNDIADYTQRSLRSQIASVPQDIALFNDTIENNIRFANPLASQDEVRAATKAALADDFILKFPFGYDTLVGERGIKLSGGERQRIAIARAFLRNPSLLIFDEATNALDAESEALVQKGMEGLMKDRATIAIAHRLGTIIDADLIVMVAGGEIIEKGTHSDLLRLGGAYARTHSLQAGSSRRSGLN